MSMTIEQAKSELMQIYGALSPDKQRAIDTLVKIEPCEDEYIKVPKKALKYRTAGMVAYNAEWLKNHFDIERVAICGAQEPCEDAISRKAVDELSKELVHITRDKGDFLCNFWEGLQKLPSVNPQEPKTGHWIRQTDDYHDYYECEHCGIAVGLDDIKNYCPNCGAKMESEDK